jgi:hypothetical protein
VAPDDGAIASSKIRGDPVRLRTRLAAAGALTAAFVLPAATPATAATTTQVVREGDISRQAENTAPTSNWVLYHRNAGDGAFEVGPGTPPAGTGSLELTTPGSSDKVFAFNYDHVGTALSDIDGMGYSTYRSAGSLQQDTALNIEVDYNGDAAGGFTTLVFEPVYNTSQGAVVNDTWQTWDAYDGGEARWWSSNAIPGLPNRDTFVSWDTVVANNPDAVILGGYGFNQGSGNAGLVANVDALSFSTAADTVTYDFEPPAPLAVTAGSATVTEGNSGTRQASFELTLSEASADPVSVDYATADGTATTADFDYVGTSGTATFAPGETTATVTVPIIGDKDVEADETFALNLSNPVGAVVGDPGSGTGTITNDDVTRLRIVDSSVVEGDSGNQRMKFKIVLSKPAPSAVTVDYATADGTATAGQDYFAETGTVTFAPGQKTRTIVITVKGDLLVEGTESFQVVLSNPSGAGMNDDTANGFINDND